MKIKQLDTCIATALSLAAEAHGWHLLAKGPGSYAQHQTFKDLYHLAHAIVDDLAEPARGRGIDINGIASLNSQGKLSDPTTPGVCGLRIADLIDHLEGLSQTAGAMSGHAWLANIAQEAQAKLGRIRFLLELR